MKRLVYFLILSVVFGGGMYYYYTVSYPRMPRQIRELNATIEARNERLISAQILAQELDLVANLIANNIALNQFDSLAQDASLPFLNFVTELLNDRDILLMSLEPDRRSVARHDYVKNSYSISFECTYEEFGQFINDLEKSDRLITVEEFEIDNTLSNLESRRQRRDIDTHIFMLKVSTITMIKHT